ncbi:MAG: hypothetical protein Q9228_006923 [Teloschistes exilis]
MTANEWATVGDEICCLPRQHYTSSRLLPVSQGRTNEWIGSLFHRLEEESLLFEAEHPEDEGAKRNQKQMGHGGHLNGPPSLTGPPRTSAVATYACLPLSLPPEPWLAANIRPHRLELLSGTFPRILLPQLQSTIQFTPGITASEYAQRRSNLASKLPKNGVAILAAADVKYRSGVVFYDYHQESNFFYLTGFNEPEAVAIIAKSATHDDHIFHLFVRPKSPKDEQWEGSRSGTQAALDVFNADESGDINGIERHLYQIVGDASEVYTDALPSNPSTSAFARLFSSRPSSVTDSLSRILEKAKVTPLKSIMNDLRNIKSDAEIANMRKAGRASGRAFTEAMRQAWTLEKDLTAYLEYMFKRKGCETSAYVPVVAGGKNASQIHYVRNDDVLVDGHLVLADAGGEYGNYITDITRTWPIEPIFNSPQEDLYNAVLSTQRTCISLCRASAANSLDKIHQIAEKTLRDSLVGLGFDMSGKVCHTSTLGDPRTTPSD